MVNNTIPCFFTCGYTEAGEMQSFLRKINDKYTYLQSLPNKLKKKKGDSKTISSDINGLTGEALFSKIIEIITKYKEDYIQSRYIIIEDDLDFRFKNSTKEDVKQYEEGKISEIHKILPDVEVLFLYACPEIEAWFIADWSNGFGCLKNDNPFLSTLSTADKQFFIHELNGCISTSILKKCGNDIELYPNFFEETEKLSELIQSIIKIDVFDSIKAKNLKIYKNLISYSGICYSKKRHGSFMLRCIDPEILNGKCNHYFSTFYRKLKSV